MNDPKAHDALIAEFLALNQALIEVLRNQAQASGDSSRFLREALERGLAAMKATNLWSTPEERREAVLADAEARFSEIVTAASPKR